MNMQKLEVRSYGKNLFEKAMREGITIRKPEDLYDAQIYAYYGEPFVRKIYNNELPERYIINKGATILFWKDGSKTIVKRCKDDKYDKRLGFLTAYFQKHCGMSKNKANKYLAGLVDEEQVEEKDYERWY